MEIVGVYLLPYDTNGDSWDPNGESFSPEQQTALTGAITSTLGVSGAVAAAAVLTGRYVASANSDPDAQGSIDLLYGLTSVGLPQSLPEARNTQRPEWPGYGWSNVPVGLEEVRIRVWLEDVDTALDPPDMIGSVVLTEDDLFAALEDGSIYPVPVLAQGSRIAFVRIQVATSR